MNFPNIIMRTLILIGVLLTIISGCGKKRGAGLMTWRTDVSPVEKNIPLLIPIESCIWQTGQKTKYGDLGVPAPEQYYIRGYIRISKDNKSRILKKYEWQSIQVDINQIDKPNFTSIADDFIISQEFKRSEEFMREHTKSSSFSDGKIILNPQTNIIYFDLSNL